MISSGSRELIAFMSSIYKKTCFRWAVLCLTVLFCLTCVSTPALDAAEAPNRAGAFAHDFPVEFGEIVYQTPETNGPRIYIIANGHRSAVSGAGNAAVVESQIETFRIGEWLINQSRIELLLPEGFFGEWPGKSSDTQRNVDDTSLRTRLADRSVFVNAELLLHERFGIGLNQVEDRALYRQARDLLRISMSSSSLISSEVHNELEYLQKLRTINLLKKAPEVVDAALKNGLISAPNAMVTIGLAHLDDLIAYLEADEIKLAELTTPAQVYPRQQEKLELSNREIGITVIVPKSLQALRS